MTALCSLKLRARLKTVRGPRQLINKAAGYEIVVGLPSFTKIIS